VGPRLLQAKRQRQPAGELTHALGMLSGFIIAQLRGDGEPLQHLQLGRLKFLGPFNDPGFQLMIVVCETLLPVHVQADVVAGLELDHEVLVVEGLAARQDHALEDAALVVGGAHVAPDAHAPGL